MDRYDLYELCVQSVPVLGRLLESVHGAAPVVLHEDFCGSAALSRWWVGQSATRVAVGTDIDGPCVREARVRAERAALVSEPGIGRLVVREGDVRNWHALTDPAGVAWREVVSAGALGPAGKMAEVVFAGNFSIGYLETRTELMNYLRGAHARLAPGGVLACDLYGGATAFATGATTRVIDAGEGRVVRCVWRHDAADPRTARVVNSLSFRVIERGEVTAELPEAFIYRWRLWGLAELREAMIEAGFASTRVIAGLGGPAGTLVPGESGGQSAGESAEDDELPADWAALVVARR